MADLRDEDDPEIWKLRRYESALHRRLRWCLAQLRHESPHLRAHPGLERPRWDEKPGPVLEPAPAPVPGPERRPLEAWEVEPPHPPFDLEPGEIPPVGESPDLPTILDSRRERKVRKAEARRQSRRRKLERLRA